MTSTYLAPYLFFNNGNCRAAMEFYRGVLGGQLDITSYSDMPAPGLPADADGVMHSSLKVNDKFEILASDGMPGEDTKVGDNVQLSLMGTDTESLTNAFNALSEGGTVHMPLEPAPWGDVFGTFTDKFGVNWMVNISPAS